MMVVKGASRCRFEKNHGKMFGWTKITSETRPQGCVPFRLRIFLSGAKTKNTSREWTGSAFFWIIPSSDATGKKGAWDGKSGKCPRFSAELFWETKTPHSKKKKMCKSLGFLQRHLWRHDLLWEAQPMENHPFLWYVSGKLVICHSYVSLQEWLFRKKKKILPSNSSPALSIGHAEPQVWQDLEKAWKKKRSSGGRVHHFLA